MELILMRHGKAEERGSRTQDSERELSAKGREKVTAAARGIMSLLKPGSPVTIWTSPLKRAVQTAEIVAAAIKGVEIFGKEPIAMGDLEALSDDLKEFDREGTLIIIGHEPYLTHWGARIGDVILPLKPAAAMAFDMSSLVPPEGNLIWFAHGQVLRRMVPVQVKAKRASGANKNRQNIQILEGD
jgi:phosphohistidine phosphatase